MSERKDGLISYHLVGKTKDGVFIQPLNDSVPATLGAWDALAFERLCSKAGARMVCTIRCRLENGRPMYHYSYFNESPSPEDEEVMNGALLRIAISGNGHLDPNRPFAAEAAIEDTKVAESLGIKLGSEGN